MSDKKVSDNNQKLQIVREGYDREELTHAQYDEAAQKKKQNSSNNNDKSKKPPKNK